MREVFLKPVKIRNVLVTNIEKSRALEDPIRASMLDMLSHKPMSIEEMVRKLKKMGYDKAPTTLRHHLDLLKKAGLVELTRIEDVQGGSVKYYASTARILNHNAPKDFEEEFASLISETSKKIIKLCSSIIDKNSDAISRMSKKLRPCPYCNPTHFKEFVILEILNRAIAEASQKKDFQELLEAK